MGFFRRRAERRELSAMARELMPQVELLEADVEARTRAVRAEFEDLPGFPPVCERCDRVMRYERVQLSPKKWRWMWGCKSCGRHVYDAALREGRVVGE